jgi:hypothetical protein
MDAYPMMVRVEEMDAESRFLALLGMTKIIAGFLVSRGDGRR